MNAIKYECYAYYTIIKIQLSNEYHQNTIKFWIQQLAHYLSLKKL